MSYLILRIHEPRYDQVSLVLNKFLFQRAFCLSSTSGYTDSYTVKGFFSSDTFRAFVYLTEILSFNLTW